MADMLKFRRGTYAQINAAPLANGTIYIATNEKAMYVDTATERIRIGDFVRVNTVKDITPPYSESALYYVEADNALLKYTGAEGGWKQVNGTDDIRTELAAVKGDVATLKSTVGSATSGLVKDVNDLKTTVGNADAGLVKDVATNASDIANLKKAVGMGDNGEVEGIGATVAQLAEDLETLETEVHGTDGNGGMKATLADYESRITTLEGKDVALKSDITAAKTAILGQDNGADFNGTVKGAYDAAATAQTQANKGVADAAAAKAIADTNKEDLSALTGRVTALDQAGTGKVAILESKVDTLEKAGYATVAQVNAAKGEVLGTEADAAGAVTVHGALKSAAAADAKAVAAANAASAAQGDIDAWETAHANDYTNTKIDELVADAKKAGTDAANAFNAYSEAHKNDYDNNTIDTKVKAASDAAATAQAKADSAYNLANAAVTDGELAEAIKSFATKTEAQGYASAVLGTSGDAAGAATVHGALKSAAAAQETANTNGAAITALQGAVGTAKKGSGDGTEGNEAATGLYKVIEDSNKALKTELSAEIDADIRAANAMEYVATIDSASKLPTTAKNGATYVVGSAFGSYAAGDMLIAQGTEDPDTGLITNPTWAHVKSGYDATLNQQITGADNKIMLSDGTKSDTDAGGAISFVATGSASVSVANNTVTIGLVWDDFT